MNALYRFSLTAATALFAPLFVFAAEDENADWFKEFGSKEVLVNYSRLAGRKIALINIVNEEISFRDGPSTGSVPLKEVLTNREVSFTMDYPSTWNGFLSSIREKRYDDAIASLRPSIYPLVKFSGLPNNKLNTHELLYNYSKTLLDANYSVEAGRLFSQLPLNSLPPQFTDLALRSCEQLAVKQKPKEALATIAGFSFDGANSEDFYPKVMSVAKTLRQSDFFEEAQYVYQKIALNKKSSESLKASLWSIYTDIRLGRVEIAQAAFKNFESKVGPESENYPLALLINARLNIARNKNQEALEFIAQAVNRCGLRDEWTPEIFYTAGECYETTSKLGVARAIYAQTDLFYPGHPYGRKSKVKLDNLPQADNKIVETREDDPSSSGPKSPNSSNLDDKL